MAALISSFLAFILVSGCSNIRSISTIQPSYFWHQLSHDNEYAWVWVGNQVYQMLNHLIYKWL
jgi:hypothetical protein